jgi:Tfp pilus assembly PilM family ATPase
VNLKDRLTSTENLLRSIRGGEVSPSRAPGGTEPESAASKGSIWTRRISLGDVFAGLAPRSGKGASPASSPLRNAAAPQAAPANQPTAEPPAAASAAPSPKPATMPFWKRPIGFRRNGKALTIGISVSGPSLCISALRTSSGTILTARCFPMLPSQAPGEKDFPAFLSASLAVLGLADANADVWAVLRSPDLDLNVLSVPKLSGGKLDAAVFWTLQKEKKFAESEYVLDYLVLGPTAETKEAKLDVLTCLARRADVERLQGAFRAAGCPLTGITAIPSAFLALYRHRGAPAGHALAANIHVEPDFSAIGLYTKDRLLFSRFIRSGGGSMADTLVDHFQELSKPRPAALDDLELPLPGAEAPEGPADQPPAVEPLDAVQAQALLRHVLLGAPKPDFATPAHLLSPTEMIDIIAPAIERLARQVERTLDYFASSQQARCDALHLSGDIFGSNAIAQALAGQLGFTPVIFDATQIVGSGELAAPADHMALAPALAAALSQPGRGVNLIANYKTRTAQEAKNAVTSRLLLGLAGMLMCIGAAGFLMERTVAAKRAELSQIRNSMTALGPALDETTIQATMNLFKTHQSALREASSRLLAPAALAEIGQRIPENVRLLTFTVEYPAPDNAPAGAPPAPGQPPAPQAPAAGQKAAPKTNGVVSIEGVVTGDRAEFDAGLSRFILALQASPMFSMPVVNESGLKELGDGGQVLYFSMRLGVK